MRSTLLLAAFTALTSALPATTKAAPPTKRGYAMILNRCPYPVYLWPVSQSRNPTHPKKINPTGSYHEYYEHSPLGGGTSLKLSRTPQLKDITQLEYMLVPNLNPGGGKGVGTVWYSGSNVDCATGRYPFENEGVMIIPSDGRCPTRECEKGERPCRDFYTTPTDDWATGACGMGASLTMVLCSGTWNIVV